MFLTVVLDVYSRRIMGWAMAGHLRTERVLEALNMASQRRPEEVTHHSDQGSQYTSLAFGKRCREMRVRPSTGSAGDCYDNAMAGSFFATLKQITLRETRGGSVEGDHRLSKCTTKPAMAICAPMSTPA